MIVTNDWNSSPSTPIKYGEYPEQHIGSEESAGGDSHFAGSVPLNGDLASS